MELLVVLGIIAVQLGLILPAFARARTATHAAGCAGNLRQWGLATLAYAADHEDLLPPEGFPNPTDRHTNEGWYIQLPAQLGLPAYHAQAWRTNAAAAPGRSLWICPANRRRSNGRNLFHYCLNEAVDGTGATDGMVWLGSLREPSRLIWMFDSKNLPAVGPPGYVHTNLHGRGAQFVFLDGHTARAPATEYWDFAARRGRTNSPTLTWRP